MFEQKMEIHKRVNGKWYTTSADFKKLLPKDIEAYVGEDVVIVWQDVHRAYYAYGTKDMSDAIHAKYHGELVTFDMPGFAYYWQYKLLEIGLDTFAKVENAAEREAIMAVEGESKEAIAEYMATRPDLYQQEIWPDDF